MLDKSRFIFEPFIVRYPSNLGSEGVNVKSEFDHCRTMSFMAWFIVVKAYTHPAMRDVSLHAVMQALSDPCRIAIVRELLQANGRSLACNEVRLSISKATRSHHFEVLRAAGIIFTEMNGTKCMT